MRPDAVFVSGVPGRDCVHRVSTRDAGPTGDALSPPLLIAGNSNFRVISWSISIESRQLWCNLF
jgi:hypothetical protein